MRTFFVLLLLTAALVVGTSLEAQRGRGGRFPGRGGAGGKIPSKGDIDKWRKGQGGTQGKSNDLKKDDRGGRDKPEDLVGWGEDGDEDRIKPGDRTSDKEKDAWIKKEAAKLGIDDDKKKYREFKKVAKKALRDSEKEDGRYAKEFKKVKDDEKLSGVSLEKHRKKLGDVWKKTDESFKKKEVLDEKQLDEWKDDTSKLRKESATDKSARQDEIRKRKIDEYKKKAADWRKARAGSSSGDGVEKKKKKEDEDSDD